MKLFHPIRNRTISLLTLTIGIGAGSVLHSQPVVVPDQTHSLFDSTDLDPVLDQADGSPTQSGWEGTAETGLGVLEAAWEADVLAAIDAEVLANTSSDFFNANPEYRHYIRSQLEIQEAEQKADWLHAAQITTDAERQQFIVALSEDIRRAIEKERRDALNDYDANKDPDARQYSDSYAEWKKEFQSDYENGLTQFQIAQSALDQEMADYDAELAATDAEFQQNLQQIDAAEDEVRTGIEDALTDLRDSLATSEYYYEETCAGAVCTVDTSTLNQSGIDLQNLIDSIQDGLDNDTPLSVLSQQMTDYLEAEEQAAIARKDYWDTQSYGAINYTDYVGAAVLPGYQWDHAYTQAVADAAGDPAALATAQANAAAYHNNLLNDLFNAYPIIGGIANYHDTGDPTVLNTALINYTGSNTDTREINTFSGADMYSTIVSCGCYSGSYGTASGKLWTARDDEVTSTAYYSSVGETFFYKDMTLKVTFGGTTEEYAYRFLYYEKNVFANATWKDNTAIANADRWQGYADDLNTNLAHWRDNIMPAITAWETQAADYRQSYADWQTEAAADRAQVYTQYQNASTDLALSRNQWLSRVEEEHRRGIQDWLGREAAATGPEEPTKRQTTASAAITPRERTDLNALLDSFKPKATTAAPDEGLPDSSLLDGVQSAFESSLLGAGQVSLISAINDRGVNRRNAITEQLAKQAIDEGYEVEVAENGTITGTRKIASGKAIKRGQGTSENDYEMELMIQNLQVTGADAIRLAETGSLFSQWDRNKIEDETRAIFDDYEDRLETKLEAEDRNIAHKNKEKELRHSEFQRDMAGQISKAKSKNGPMASFANSVMNSMMGGMSFQAASTNFVQSQMTNMAYEAVGWPQEILSGMISGMDFHTSAKSFVKERTNTLIAEKAAKDSGGAIPSGILNGILNGESIENSVQQYAENKAYEEIEKKVPGLSAILRGMKAKKEKEKQSQKQMQDTVVTVAAVTAGPFTAGGSMYALAAYKAYEAGRTTGNATSAAVAGAAGLVTAYTAGAVNMNATWDPENGLEGGVGFGVGGAANVGLSYSKEGGYGGDVGVQLGEVATVGVSYNQTEGAGVNASLSGIDSLEGAGLNLRYTQNTGLSGGVSYSAGGATGGLSYSQEEGVGANLSYTDEIAENTSATGSLSWTQNSGTSANVSANWRGEGNDEGEGPPKFNDRFDGFGGGVGWNQNDGLNANVSVGGTNAFNYDEANGWTGNANYEQSHFEKERTEYIKDVQDYNRREAAKELKKENDNIRDILAEKTGKSPEELAEMTPQELHDLAQETPGGLEALSDAGYEFEVGGSRGEGWLSDMMGGIVDNVVNSFGGASNDLVVKEDGEFKVKTCFVAGTKIIVRGADGLPEYREIQEIKVGDWVLAYEEGTGRIGWHQVSNAWSLMSENGIVTIAGDAGNTIKGTPEHPVYVVGQGWKQLGTLKPGDEIHTVGSVVESNLREKSLIELSSFESAKGSQVRSGRPIRVVSVAYAKQRIPVYNFTVQGAHTYFVGGSKGQWALVHNAENYGDQTISDLNKTVLVNGVPVPANVIEKAQKLGYLNHNGFAEDLDDLGEIGFFDKLLQRAGNLVNFDCWACSHEGEIELAGKNGELSRMEKQVELGYRLNLGDKDSIINEYIDNYLGPWREKFISTPGGYSVLNPKDPNAAKLIAQVELKYGLFASRLFQTSNGYRVRSLGLGSNSDALEPDDARLKVGKAEWRSWSSPHWGSQLGQFDIMAEHGSSIVPQEPENCKKVAGQCRMIIDLDTGKLSGNAVNYKFATSDGNKYRVFLSHTQNAYPAKTLERYKSRNDGDKSVEMGKTNVGLVDSTGNVGTWVKWNSNGELAMPDPHIHSYVEVNGQKWDKPWLPEPVAQSLGLQKNSALYGKLTGTPNGYRQLSTEDKRLIRSYNKGKIPAAIDKANKLYEKQCGPAVTDPNERKEWRCD